MGKKKDKKKDFGSILEANAKKIKIEVPGWEQIENVADMIQVSVSGTTACPLDAMIPATVTECAKSALDLPYMAISTNYTQHVYSMYELGIKSQHIQTLVVPLYSDAAEGLLKNDRFSDLYDTMCKYTDIALVYDEVQKKISKKLESWADEEGGCPMFVIRIPNLLMFHESIKKDVVSKPVLFDLIIIVSNASKKTLKKLKKEQKPSSDGVFANINSRRDMFDEYSIDFINGLLSVIDNYGSSSVHIPLWEEFYYDAYMAAVYWASRLIETSKNRTGLKRLVFSTSDPKYLIEFNNNITSFINKDADGYGMRVV